MKKEMSVPRVIGDNSVHCSSIRRALFFLFRIELFYIVTKYVMMKKDTFIKKLKTYGKV